MSILEMIGLWSEEKNTAFLMSLWRGCYFPLLFTTSPTQVIISSAEIRWEMGIKSGNDDDDDDDKCIYIGLYQNRAML